MCNRMNSSSLLNAGYSTLALAFYGVDDLPKKYGDLEVSKRHLISLKYLFVYLLEVSKTHFRFPNILPNFPKKIICQLNKQT